MVKLSIFTVYSALSECSWALCMPDGLRLEKECCLLCCCPAWCLQQAPPGLHCIPERGPTATDTIPWQLTHWLTLLTHWLSTPLPQYKAVLWKGSCLALLPASMCSGKVREMKKEISSRRDPDLWEDSLPYRTPWAHQGLYVRSQPPLTSRRLFQQTCLLTWSRTTLLPAASGFFLHHCLLRRCSHNSEYDTAHRAWEVPPVWRDMAGPGHLQRLLRRCGDQLLVGRTQQITHTE